MGPAQHKRKEGLIKKDVIKEVSGRVSLFMAAQQKPGAPDTRM